jgi:hypothetical protein
MVAESTTNFVLVLVSTGCTELKVVHSSAEESTSFTVDVGVAETVAPIWVPGKEVATDEDVVVCWLWLFGV